MNLSKLAKTAVVTFLISGGGAYGDKHSSIKESVDRIHEVATAKKYYNLSETEKALIKEISTFGSEAIPYLAKLIVHPKREVAVVAAEAFEEIAGDVEFVDAKFLPAILHGLDHDHSGLPNVLAKIKTPKARAEFVNRYLKDGSSPHNQFQNGFSWYGADFLPHLIKVIRSEHGRDRQNVYLLGTALKSFSNEDRKGAALELLKSFDSKNVGIETKRVILAVLSDLGSPALGVEDRLINIWENQPDLKDEAGRALVGIRSKKAGIILAEQLLGNAHYLLLRDIAEVGIAAKGAGATVANLLDDSNWTLRLGAARTIGFIGYHGADEKLIELLNDPSDVRLNFVVAESLGRLRSTVALKALKQVGKDHWHPAVREAARTAVQKIESNSNYELKYHRENFPFEYFEFQNMGIEELPEDLTIPAITDPLSLAAHARKDSELLKRLAYTIEIVSYGASDEEEQETEKGDDGIIVVDQNNMVEHRRKLPQSPEVGVRVSNGWLLGSDRGEWGGELVFKGDNKDYYKIIDENIGGLFKLGERFIAVTGLAHLSLNDGMIYEVKLAGGKWKAEPWRALPGAPQCSGKVENGEVIVATHGGGVVIISEGGHLRMCDIALKPIRDEAHLFPSLPK